MRFFLTAILTGLMISAPSIALAGLPPTRAAGQSGTLSTTFDFKTPYNQVTKYSGTGALLELDSYNLLKNPRFEAQTYSTSWAVTGGTLAAATSTNIFFGKSATWDSSAASQEFSSDLYSVPEGFKANNCEGSIYLKVPSGTATHTIRVVDGSSNVLASQTIVNSTYFTKNTLTFPCPTSGSIALQIISVASNEPLIAIDEAYLGLARNVGVADLITEWRTDSTTGSWTANATYTARWRRVGDTMELQGSVATSAAPTPAGSLIFNIPSAANCTIDQSKLANQTSYNLNVLGSGATRDDSAGGLRQDVTVYYNSTSSLFFQTLPLASGSSHAGTTLSDASPMAWANLDGLTFEARFPCVGWTASQVVTPEQQRAPKVTVYTSGSGTFTPSNGATYMHVMVVGGGGGGSGSGSSGAGAGGNGGNSTFGSSLLIASGGTGSDASGSGGAGGGTTINSPAVTILNVTGGDGGARMAASTSINFYLPFAYGGANPLGGAGIGGAGPGGNARLNTGGGGAGGRADAGGANHSGGGGGAGGYIEALISNPSGSYSYAVGTGGSAGSAGTGGHGGGAGAAGRIVVTEYFGYTTAILANSVSTGRTNGDKIGSARLDCDSASTIKSNPQGMVSTISNISSGTCSLVLATGYFSAAPICTVSWDGSGGSSSDFYSVCSSATACDVGGGGAVTTAQINMMCIGPR